jgi:hypothetical protein
VPYATHRGERKHKGMGRATLGGVFRVSRRPERLHRGFDRCIDPTTPAIDWRGADDEPFSNGFIPYCNFLIAPLCRTAVFLRPPYICPVKVLPRSHQHITEGYSLRLGSYIVLGVCSGPNCRSQRMAPHARVCSVDYKLGTAWAMKPMGRRRALCSIY